VIERAVAHIEQTRPDLEVSDVVTDLITLE
jgi:hypothetical protein